MKNLSIKQMVTCAIMTALLCVLSPLSIPIGPVPISLQILVIYITVILLGTKLSFISCAVYLLIGLVGVPVFSGFSGGVAKLAGPTGGYLIGFLFMILVSGFIYEKFSSNNIIIGLGMLAGLIVAYAFGTAWFVHQMDYTVGAALAVCVWPFVPFDIAKIVIAIFLGKTVKKALNKAGLL